MDLNLVQVEDYSLVTTGWLGSKHGTDSTRTIKLNLATFTGATHFPNGWVLDGITLGKITATGLYGPYESDAVDGRQNVVGFLYATVKAHSASATPLAALLHHGTVVVAKAPLGTATSATTPGTLDAAAQTALRDSGFYFI